MDKQLEKLNGTLILYMTTTARQLYVPNWKTALIPTIKEWMGKVTERAEMTQHISDKR